jgi:hypothetical protein
MLEVVFQNGAMVEGDLIGQVCITLSLSLRIPLGFAI